MKGDIKARDGDFTASSCDAKQNSDDEINGLKVMEKFGRFQIMSIVLLCPAFFLIGTMLFSFVFINIEPEYECRSRTANTSVSDAIFYFTASKRGLLIFTCSVVLLLILFALRAIQGGQCGRTSSTAPGSHGNIHSCRVLNRFITTYFVHGKVL